MTNLIVSVLEMYLEVYNINVITTRCRKFFKKVIHCGFIRPSVNLTLDNIRKYNLKR
jgi:hypothetical protein